MTEKDLREELKKAYEEILGPFTENGILRITDFDKITGVVDQNLREELKKDYEEILGPFTPHGVLRITDFDKIQEQVEKDK